MNKIIKILIVFLFFCSATFAKVSLEEQKNDFLYSEEYFDYLIDCAIQNHHGTTKAQDKNETEEEIKFDDNSQEEYISNEYEPFKLKIESTTVKPYKEIIKKEDTKLIIPIGKKFSFIEDTTQWKNKYNSNDYRISAGGEYKLNNYFSLSAGLETNFRNLDQIPISKKIYVTPTVKLNDILSLSLYNKFNTSSYSSDHDVKLNISPFKSKVSDFSIYTGLTRDNNGSYSESVSFTTNLYFF